MRTVKKKKKTCSKRSFASRSPNIPHVLTNSCWKRRVDSSLAFTVEVMDCKDWDCSASLAFNDLFSPPNFIWYVYHQTKIHPLQHTHTHKDVSFSLSVFVCLLPISLYYYYFFLITRSDLPGPYLCSRVALTATVRTVLQLHFLHVFELWVAGGQTYSMALVFF